MSIIQKKSFLILTLVLIAGCGSPQASEIAQSGQQVDQARPQMTTDEARAIAKQAYLFGFSFVANYRVLIAPFVENKPLAMGAGLNEFAHMKDFFPPQQRDTA